jgi:hypothetical protein
VPQPELAVPGWQSVLASQQPVGQVWAVQVGVPVHCPSASQLCPGRQPGPHVPPLPQPSGPHSRPVQFGAQHNPEGLHSVAPGRQHAPSQQCPEAGPAAAHCPPESGPSATGAQMQVPFWQAAIVHAAGQAGQSAVCWQLGPGSPSC